MKTIKINKTCFKKFEHFAQMPRRESKGQGVSLKTLSQNAVGMVKLVHIGIGIYPNSCKNAVTTLLSKYMHQKYLKKTLPVQNMKLYI